MKASGASTNALASASGLSSTMAMSISLPSFLMGLPPASAPGLPLLCSHKGSVPTPLWLSAPVIQFVVGPLGAQGN